MEMASGRSPVAEHRFDPVHVIGVFDPILGIPFTALGLEEGVAGSLIVCLTSSMLNYIKFSVQLI